MECIEVSQEEIEKMREESNANLSEFEKRLFSNLELLFDRVNRLKVIESGTLDYWTYYDAVLTQIRAMFIEQPGLKKNYTVQNYLISIGQEEIAKDIDNYLAKELYEGITFRKAIKCSVDKFIAHHDKLDTEDIVIEQMCRVKLTEPNREYNISNILNEFTLLLLRGTAKAMVEHCNACSEEKSE